MQPKKEVAPAPAPTQKSTLVIFNQAQNKVREQLMHGQPLSEVLETLIKALQQVHMGMKGAILSVNQETQTLHSACASDLPKSYTDQIEGLKVRLGEGSCGSAAFLKERVIVENIAADSRWGEFHIALDYGLRACWSEPILSSDRAKVLGTFAMYYDTVKTPLAEEIELLELAAGLAGTAMEWHQVLNERKLLESNLREVNSDLLGLNRDLDKRVQDRTTALEYQNRINKTITDNATAALFMMNENGYCTFMNPAAVAMIGFTMEEVKEKPLHDLIHHTHPDGTHYPMAECPIDRALPQDSSVRAHEDVFIRKDGTFFPVLCAASPIKENGVPVGTVVEVRDVTREKQAQQEIVESAERFKMLLEAMPQLSWTANAAGELDYINDRWISDYSHEDPQIYGFGATWMKSVHPDDVAHVDKAWAHAVATGQNYETVFRIRQLDGVHRWHLVRALPLRDRQGKVMKWFGTSTDIHEQRLAMEHLAQTQAQLEQANGELSQKNQELTRTNADLDNFIYTASHDLRAPIINLEGLLVALEEELGEPTENIRPLLGMMDRAIVRFKKTIEDLTDISKTQRNTDEVSEIIDLPELLDEVKESVCELIRKEAATITSDFSDMNTIRFSQKNLRSILYNLVSNAIKYRSPERPAMVKVSAVKVHDQVRLRVQDNGLGVNMSYADQLFGMFKRLHDHVEGSGVGLYIVKRIVENANGRIEVQSEIGAGTTIDVYLPL
ncbi:PAS domain S-box protein [Pontibacter sp. E15-1]|uniref:PAS domain S-box protein n=1 Tax=Pontibacter sp. E15-1 TaxID=2919918 RepID=UPI001F4FF078|nr:PAS domain S-box protein [Pontibacter sp. E15-1]MCJ8164821.1 PAS domain S-box protein [Pontibacter sp. E15-1]